MVVTVLAECDPTGTSISEVSLVAASVGGRLRGDGEEDLATTTTMTPVSRGHGSSKTGRVKVAKLECQCCFAEHDFEYIGMRRGESRNETNGRTKVEEAMTHVSPSVMPEQVSYVWRMQHDDLLLRMQSFLRVQEGNS